MPTISTGNPGWDQNLSTLGNALFPDPSKVGQGYYYGAEARAKQLESNKLINQQNNQLRLLQMQPDSPQQLAPPTYSQPDLPGAFPVLNPPSNLPMARPGATQGQPLSSTIVGPSGGAVPQQTMSPQQAAAVTPDQFNNHPANQGQMPPVSPPVPGASPLTPNTTTTNGQVPAGDPTAQGFHPGSVTPAGGGIKMSGPAAADGSPARTPVSLATYVATASAAGMDAATAALQGSAYLASLYKQGSIDRDTYHQLLGGTGNPQLGVQDSAAATSIKTTGMTVAGNLATTRATQAGETARKGMDVTFVPNPDDPTQGRFVPLAQLQGVGGTPGYNPTAPAITSATQNLEVQPGGPGTAAKSMPAFMAQRNKVDLAPPPSVAATVAGHGSEIKTYIRPDDPTQEKTMRADEAAANGWVEKPGADEMMRIIDKAISRETDPEKRQQLRDKKNMLGAAPKPVDAEEIQKRGFLADTALEKFFPVPTGTHPMTNTEAAGAGVELGPVLTDLTNQYLTQSTDRAVRDNPVAAANKALEQLLKQKFINPKQSRDATLNPFSSTSINKPAYDKAGNAVAPQKRFPIDLVDPNTGKPFAPGTAPTRIPMERPLSSAIVPPAAAPAPAAAAAPTAAAGAMPPGALAAAPGQPDGKTGTVGGTPTIVRGGFAYPR